MTFNIKNEKNKVNLRLIIKMSRNLYENIYVFNKKEFDHSINMICISAIPVFLILLLLFAIIHFKLEDY